MGRSAGPWLRAYYSGWFDTFHGLVSGQDIAITDDVALGPRRVTRWLPSRLRRALPLRSGPRRFRIPLNWGAGYPLRYLTFQLQMPSKRDYFLLQGRIRGQPQFTLDSRELVRHRVAPTGYTVRLHSAVGTAAAPVTALTCDITLHERPGGRLRLRDLKLLTYVREDVLRHLDWLRAWNVTAETYTSHGGGLILGAPHMHRATDMPAGCLSDWPANAHYCADLLRDAGVTFVNTWGNTHCSELKHIGELVFLNGLYDGTVVYDFHRFACEPAPAGAARDGRPTVGVSTPTEDVSCVDFLGAHIAAAYAAFGNRPGYGGLLYTHLTVSGGQAGAESASPADGLLNAEARAGLELMAERFYNLSGACGERDRVYVAPTTVLLRMARMHQQASGRGWYEPERHTLHLQRWADPVTGRVAPQPGIESHDLAGMTFYVRDSFAARLLVDGTNVDTLVRNPADALGRESVTVVDGAFPRILLGRARIDAARIDTGRGGLELAPRPSGPEGPRPSHSLVLHAPLGEWVLRLGGIAACDYQHLCIAVTRSRPESRWRVDLACASGLTLGVCEEGFPDAAGAYQVRAWEGATPRPVIVPLHQLLEAVPVSARRVPGNDVVALHVLLAGAPGDRLDVETIRLLRDSPRPPPTDGCIVRGRVRPDADIDRVCLQWGGHTWDTRPAQTGYYFFRTRIPPGEVVHVSARTSGGRTVAPCTGPEIEVGADTVDVDFL